MILPLELEAVQRSGDSASPPAVSTGAEPVTKASISSPAASLPQNPLRGIGSAVRIESGAARFIDVRGALKVVRDPSPPAVASASIVSVGSVASGTSMTTVSSEPDSMVVDVGVSSNEHGSATMTRNVTDSESDVSHGGGDGVAPVLVVQPGAPQSRSQVDVGTTSSGCGIGDPGGQPDVARGTARSSCPSPIQKPATTTLGNGSWDVEVAALCYTAKYQPAARAGRASMALDWFALGKTMEAVVRHRGSWHHANDLWNGWALSVSTHFKLWCSIVAVARQVIGDRSMCHSGLALKVWVHIACVV